LSRLLFKMKRMRPKASPINRKLQDKEVFMVLNAQLSIFEHYFSLKDLKRDQSSVI
jgi:hypothetical protein